VMRNDASTKLIASHDLDFLSKVVTRIVMLDQGRVAADGSVDAVLSDVRLLEAAGLI